MDSVWVTPGLDHDATMRTIWLDGRPTDRPTDPGRFASSRREPVEGRPFVAASMVASIDGSTVVEGRARPLSGDVDSAVFLATRHACDVVLVGAETVRAERYGPSSRSTQRIGVVTHTGSLDWESDLFRSGCGFVVSGENGPDVPDHVDTLRAGAEEFDPRVALRRLSEVSGPVTTVHLEGGSVVLGLCLAADLVDELNVTTSPHVALGSGHRIATGPERPLLGFDLDQVAVDGGFVFSRWRRPR